MATKSTDTAYGRGGGRTERAAGAAGLGLAIHLALVRCACGRSTVPYRHRNDPCPTCGMVPPLFVGDWEHDGTGPIVVPAELLAAEPEPSATEDWRPVPSEEGMANARAALAGRPDPVVAVAAPFSSRFAAALVAPHVGTQRRRILELLVDHPDGLTDDELGELYPGLSGNSVRPRRGKLVEEGYVLDSGQRRPNKGGVPVTVYVASPAGRACMIGAGVGPNT